MVTVMQLSWSFLRISSFRYIDTPVEYYNYSAHFRRFLSSICRNDNFLGSQSIWKTNELKFGEIRN